MKMKVFEGVEATLNHKVDKDWNRVVEVVVTSKSNDEITLTYSANDLCRTRLEADVRRELGIETP